MILTCLIATYSDILTSASSSTPIGMPSSYSGTLPYPIKATDRLYSCDFGIRFEPRTFSAQAS